MISAGKKTLSPKDQRPPVGAICTWDTNAPHLCVYANDITYGMVLGYASQQSQVLKPGQKDCSKAIMAPIALEDCSARNHSWGIHAENSVEYIDLTAISHIDIHRIMHNHGKNNKIDLPSIRKKAIAKIKETFQNVTKPFWLSLMFPDQHFGHKRPVFVIGKNPSNKTYVAMLDCRHCPDIYGSFNNSYVSSNGIYGPQIRYILPELITFPQECGQRPNFGRELLLPDKSVIQEMKRHIFHKQLTCSQQIR